jgi:hypothetical protein
LSSLHPQLPGKHWGIAELLRSQPGFAHMFEMPSICSTHAEDPSVVDHPARAAPLMKAPLSSHQAVRVAPLLKALDDLLRLRLLPWWLRTPGEACVYDLHDALTWQDRADGRCDRRGDPSTKSMHMAGRWDPGAQDAHSHTAASVVSIRSRRRPKRTSTLEG